MLAEAVAQVRAAPREPLSEDASTGCPRMFAAPEAWQQDLLAGRSQPRLAVARVLRFVGPEVPGLCARVARCGELGELEGLRVECPRWRPLELAGLSEVAPRLRWLWLESCGLEAGAAEELTAMRFERLEGLFLPGNSLGARGVAELARLAAPRLRWLDLGGSKGGPAGASGLAGSGLAGQLEVLVLGSRTPGPRGLGSSGLSALARGQWTELRTLRLGCEEIEDVEALVRSSLGRSLERIDLSNNPIGDAGLARLTSMSSLRDLSLAGCGIGPAGVRALAGSELRLSSLVLAGNPIGDAGVIALAGSPVIEGIGRLDLSRVGMTDAGIAALVALPWLRKIKKLELEQHSNGVTAEGRRRLQAALSGR